ncbi:hypothetical protein BKA62DRAFT_721975 [Auriculariales sp. MPI-PUGE-AT-0066]|nr:hypothetical protein BKA62DRAFT_721975 [Auriculariales sp. MPI-PUGE-AT-0066]
MDRFLGTPPPVHLSISHVDELLAILELPEHTGAATTIRSVGVEYAISGGSPDDRFESALCKSLSVWSNARSVTLFNVDQDFIRDLTSSLNESSLSKNVTERDIPLSGYILHWICSRSGNQVTTHTEALRAFEIIACDGHARPATEPIAHRTPLLVSWHDTCTETTTATVMCGSQNYALRSIALYMWALDGRDISEFWQTLVDRLVKAGIYQHQLKHLTTLDVRAAPAVAYTETLASIVSICPRLRCLAIGSRPLQHDRASDPETEQRIFAVLAAAPRTLRVLLVNCYGFKHGETMVGLGPFLERLVATGALWQLRKLILESGSTRSSSHLLQRMEVPQFLRERRVVVASRIVTSPPLGLD